MSFSELQQELGEPLTAAQVGKLFGVDPRTVKKYAEFYGGQWVAPGCLRFFENLIRRKINAESVQGSWEPLAWSGEDQRQGGGNQVVRSRTGQRRRMDDSKAMGDGETERASGPIPSELRAGLEIFDGRGPADDVMPAQKENPQSANFGGSEYTTGTHTRLN